MDKNIILGAIQGLTEWLPVSSSAFLVLLQNRFWPELGLSKMIELSLFLHGGTFLAGLIYFQKEIREILCRKVRVLKLLIITTAISGGLGFLLLQLVKNIESQIALTGQVVTAAIGVFLVVTGLVQLGNKKESQRKLEEIEIKDALFLGLVQGVTVLPGFSRSGLTVGLLVYLGFEKVDALRLSFIAGLPLILAGNILLNLDYIVDFSFGWGMVVSFVVGLLSIHLLLKLARKINFGYFVLFFGLITFLSSFLVG